MRHNFMLLVCIAALVIGAAATDALIAHGQDKSEGDKRSLGKAAAPVKPIELVNCPIELVDEVTLACDRPGIIEFVKAREGDAVRAGEDIVGLQDEVARATLAIVAKEAESDVGIRYAKAAGEVAKAELDKAREANRNIRAIPEVEVRRLELTLEKTKLEHESAQHKQAVNLLKRDEAQAQLNTHRVKAPFDGVVTRIHRRKGEAVRQGDQVIEIVSTRRVRVEGLVTIRDIYNVKPGAEVEVRLDIPDAELDVERHTFTGRIVFVDVKAEPVSQAVRVWAEVDNPDNILRAGLVAKMTIHPERK